jgi:hypothetical protein
VTAFEWDVFTGASRRSRNAEQILGFDPEQPITAARHKDHDEAFDPLADFIAEDVTSMSDDQLLAEATEDYAGSRLRSQRSSTGSSRRSSP